MNNTPKIVSVVGLGTMTSEQAIQKAAKIFQGEMMTCIVCGAQKKSDSLIESDWRAIQVGNNVYYACPNEFPPDGASAEEFTAAYMIVLEKILKALGG